MICLDTTFLIDLFNGRVEARKALEKYQKNAFTTEINRFEVLLGIYRKKSQSRAELELAKEFFSSIDTFPFDGTSADRSAQILGELIRQGNVIDANDALIAGTILANGHDQILTRNANHFSRIEGIAVTTY